MRPLPFDAPFPAAPTADSSARSLTLRTFDGPAVSFVGPGTDDPYVGAGRVIVSPSGRFTSITTLLRCS
jgi:hypothetical protein